MITNDERRGGHGPDAISNHGGFSVLCHRGHLEDPLRNYLPKPGRLPLEGLRTAIRSVHVLSILKSGASADVRQYGILPGLLIAAIDRKLLPDHFGLLKLQLLTSGVSCPCRLDALVVLNELRDGVLFPVAANVNVVVVGAAVGQAVAG